MKNYLKKLLFPCRSVGILLGPLLVPTSIAVILLGWGGSPLAYVTYLLSAYGLYLLVVCGLVPAFRAIKLWLRKSPYVDRYYTDKTFYARVVLYRGIVLNIAYAVFKFAVGVYYRSFWFIAIALYYMVLIGMKVVLVRADIRFLRKKEERTLLGEWRAYLKAACLMMLLNLTLSGIVVQVIRDGQSYSYPGFVIFAMAFYAFYRIIVAAIRLVKDRKRHGPIFSAAKAIDFTFAVVAMFTLQTAMLTTFDTSGTSFPRTANILSGTAAAVIVLGIATYMIIHARKQMKQLNSVS